MTIGESQAFGGVLKGSLALAASDAGAEFKSQLQFTDVDLEKCLGEMFQFRRLDGRGDIAVAHRRHRQQRAGADPHPERNGQV